MESQDEQRFAQIIRERAELLKQNPLDMSSHFRIGSAYQQLGQHENALRHYGAILEREPDDHESLRACGVSLAGLGRKDEAFEHLRRAVDLWPKEPLYYADFGDVLASLGRKADAQQAYEAGLERALPNEDIVERIYDGLERLDA